MISLNSVSKQFNNHLALDNFSLEIPEGEIFALLGPNGAGKTTTINLLLGFLSPDSGTVSVAGIEPSKNPAEARKITGYIPENVNLYPQLTGLENLKYFTQLASSKYSDEDLRHFLSTCGLQKSAMDRPLGTYSKGMRQKVGIAIAYAKKAKILLMDEPASGLDPLASKELSDLIRKLAKMGTTVLMASHDLFRVKETADRIGIIHQGKLLKSLQAAEVTANDLEEIYLGKKKKKIMKTIIWNEWILLRRNPWFIGLITVLILIVGLTSYFGVAETKKLIAMEAEASAEIRSQWDNQEAGNPHNAAHYGTYLFKPSSALTGFDEGVNGVVGKTLYLEGHRQNEIQYSEASQSLQISRFGKLRPALLLQLIIPLLLIFLVFSSVRTERESDRVRILLVQGGDFRQILFGKIMAYWLLSVLFLLVTLSLQLILQTEQLTTEVILRTGLIGVGYAGFYWIISSCTAYLTANLRQAGTALSLMLACWIVWGVFLPKISGTLAEQLYQLPTRQAFADGMRADRASGLDGHNPEEEKLAALKDSVLRKYQVETVEELPINFDGILMQADEEIGNIVWDKHFGDLNKVLRKQKTITQVSSIPNPLQSLQSLSMGLSGTDYFHHADFMLKAEQYRRQFIKSLNEKHAYGGSKTGDWEWAADQEFYRSLEDFAYSAIPLNQVLNILWTDVLILFGWVIGGFLLINSSKFRI